MSLSGSIQALDSLQRQLAISFGPDLLPATHHGEPHGLHSSMAVMRRLLVDAQAKFRRMVEENKQLAARIDGDLAVAHEEVAAVRGELHDASRRLDEHLAKVAAGAGADPSAAEDKPAAAEEPAGIRPPSPIAGAAGDASATGGVGVGAASASTGATSAAATAASDADALAGGGSRPKGKSGGCSERDAVNNPAAAMRLRLENERLKCEVAELRMLVASRDLTAAGAANSAAAAGAAAGAEGAAGAAAAAGGGSGAEESLRVQALDMELRHAREALAALKADRKRLKAEKFDLLNQMKQLYGTLEDKEKELRDFIRNYEQRMRESEASLQQLSTEREERERERWSLLRHARDEAERSLALAAQLDAKEQHIQQLQDQLLEARRQLAAVQGGGAVVLAGGGGGPGSGGGSGGSGGGGGCLSDQESLASMSLSASRANGGLATPTAGLGLLPGDRGSCSADSGVRGSSDRESGGATSGGGNLSDSTTDGTPTITVEGSNVDTDSVSLISYIATPHTCQSATTPKDCSPSLSPLNANAFSKSIDNSVLSRSVEQLSNPMELEPRRPKNVAPVSRSGGSRGGTWGSISRVFARSRHRKAASPSQEEASDAYRSWSPLTEEGYAEKLRLLREAASIPMERWRAPTVLAWLEIALGMPQYGPRCAENVKSGKVLLELSDVELELGLGITHPMHRKKLRLAIEEHRHPALVRYPCIAQLGHTWVSSEWLPDLGLAQYSENFATNMVDARMLDHLSKKELEKFLGVTRKFHQASIVHGIHLLRMMKYDRQALAVRRHQCETIDADPLVWTNQRFIRWARNIDLSEYAENLKDSGVHGALVVLEPSFNGDTMATALGIPPSKNIIRRHLSTELEALVLPARAAFEHFVRVSKSERRRAEKLVGGGSLGRSFSRSYAGGLAERSSPATERPGPGPAPEQEKERRRSSLRTYSLLYLKKGSLSRALGLKMRQDNSSKRDSRDFTGNSNGIASPSSSSENSSSVVSFNCRVPSPQQTDANNSASPQRPAIASSGTLKKRHHHRRVKSIGDIDTVTVTPV
ncbi:kazrin isoform X1 [Schistocerca gregaria]|uniref:kazrin isoform X1 n=1 Tax=Schistocerca gregaria TaxID=7010 RepID=UPI00211E2666|nr:kazrin isoform X1 [Schistocerca gregaria]